MCKRVNRFFPLLILGYLGGSILVSLVLAILGVDMPLWSTMVLSEGMLLLPALIYVLAMRINVPKCMPYRLLKPLDALLAILFGYAMVPLMLLISNISMMFASNQLAETAGDVYYYPLVVELILMAVIPPLVEEFVFRGIFYHSYRKNGILGAALLSGLLFGIVHMNINQFCYAFVLGIVFALLVEATSSMWAAVLAHAAINSYSIILFKLMPSSVTSDTFNGEAQSIAELPVPIMITTLVMLGIFALAFGAVAYKIYVCLAKRNNRLEYMKEQIGYGLRARNGERFVTLPLIITAVLCIAYMIVTEYVF